jgi:hypothetical protein
VLPKNGYIDGLQNVISVFVILNIGHWTMASVQKLNNAETNKYSLLSQSAFMTYYKGTQKNQVTGIPTSLILNSNFSVMYNYSIKLFFTR